MTLYEIIVSIDKNGFNVKTDECEVIRFEKNGYIVYDADLYIASSPSSDLDKYKNGMLKSLEHPNISIKTLNGNKVGEYIEEMKNIIICNIIKRKEILNKQLMSVGIPIYVNDICDICKWRNSLTEHTCDICSNTNMFGKQPAL